MTTNVRRAGHIDRFKLRVKQLSRSSFSTSSLDFSASAATAENCRGGKRGLSLAASGKILTNIAVNWRARSVQAKNERRERRATKTLAIVLGTTLFEGFYTLLLNDSLFSRLFSFLLDPILHLQHVKCNIHQMGNT